MDEVMTVAELIETLGRLNPAHEVHVLDLGGMELVDVRVDDQAQLVTLIGG